MTFAAGASPIPVVIGLLVALGVFVTWAALLTHPWRPVPTVTAAVVDTAGSAPASAPVPAPSAMPEESVTVIVGAHYRIAAPDDEAVAAAMASRVPPTRPRLRLVVDTDAVALHDVQRSA